MSTPEGQRPGTDELRASFRAEAGQATEQERAGTARRARNVVTLLAVVAGVAALVGAITRLGQGAGSGAWLALPAAGLAASAVAVVLARRGRTRWGLAVLAVGVACAQVGDTIAARALH